MKLKNYKPKKAHKIVQGIQKQMTANERDYWWRLTHRVIQTRNRDSKWQKDENGESVTRECPVCKAEELRLGSLRLRVQRSEGDE